MSGGTPTTRLNWRRRVVAVPMPVALATDSMPSSVASSNCWARRTRWVSSHWSGVWPVTERKSRPRWRGLVFARRARSVTVSGWSRRSWAQASNCASVWSPLTTAALGERTAADEVHVAYGLSSWHPTPGTRAAGRISHDRRAGRRLRFTGGALQYHDDKPVQQDWIFPEPLGRRRVIAEFTMADVVTIPSHLAVPEVRTYMTVEAAGDLADEDTPAPVPTDALGRSDQSFVVDVLVRSADGERRATARGQDIYAITAPLAVEAVQRILAGETRATGVASAGAMFDPADFLRSLPLSIELP